MHTSFVHRCTLTPSPSPSKWCLSQPRQKRVATRKWQCKVIEDGHVCCYIAFLTLKSEELTGKVHDLAARSLESPETDVISKGTLQRKCQSQHSLSVGSAT